MNRLAHERSPYLLQHAANPVDWFAWGEDAFGKARSEDKPIFLSIGYSTCHWCHVMERESFEDAAVAAVLNEHFVSIKVDREERPDVDRVYMTFVQATTGSGGWPMSVWLTPELKPFYGGTYFPPSPRFGRPGFSEMLQEIARVWRVDREKVARSADALTQELRSRERQSATAGVPGAEALDRTVGQFREIFDPHHGGFGDSPKFPRPSELLFLLREHARTGAPEPLEMTLRSLRAMALGGMRDHIGGGFHRYAVDAAWRVPHFEKMLYDQAQLVLAYIEGAQASGDSFYAEVAEDTLDYVMKEMTDAGGAFYCAEDADSIPPVNVGEEKGQKAEGAFYLWSAEEIDRLFGPEAPVVRRRFGIAPGGNAPIDPQHEFVHKNLLYIAESIDEVAANTGKTASEVVEILNRARVTMFDSRAHRPRPSRDDKILTAWNGLMIAAFARVGRVLAGRCPERAASAQYLERARQAASFIRLKMWNAETRTLCRRYRDGHAQIEGYAEDYAYLILGVIELFQAEADPQWLEWAIALQQRQDELFWDDGDGGWFSTTGNDQSVLLRLKEDYDGAEPTASSVSVGNLLTLSHLVMEESWSDRIERTLKLFGTRLAQMGRGVPMMAAALSTFVVGITQIIIVRGADTNSEIERALASHYLPFTVSLAVTREAQDRLAARLPLIAAMRPIDGKTTAYVCKDFSCQQPVTTAADFERQL